MDLIEERRKKRREYDAEYKKTDKGKATRAEYEKSDAYKAKQAKYNKSDKGQKSQRIRKWKFSGVKHPNMNELHDVWKAATNCADCEVILAESGINGSNRKCLDHDHETGLFRDIVCNTCNTKRGIIDRLSALNLHF